tara:strand:- start:126 stop:1181 length:1056 start_codon:yes stop_codon:yes gene_type:complete
LINFNSKRYFFFSLIIFFCCETYLRVINSGFNVQPINLSSYNHHEHPKNFKFRSYHPSKEWGNFLISFDEFGNREIEGICKKDTRFNSNIIFLGDSFTEGIQVSDTNSFPGLVQKELCDKKIKISNLGVTSYSPVLTYLQLKNQLQKNKKIKIKGSLIIHLLSENDAEDDRKYFKQIKFLDYENSSSEKLFLYSKKRTSILKILSRKFYTFRLLRRIVLTFKVSIMGNKEKINIPETGKLFKSTDKCTLLNEDLKTTIKFVNKIDSLVKSYGARYVLSALPDKPKHRENTNYSCYKEIAGKSIIKFIDSPEELFKNPSKNYFKKDLHLNILGNKVLANKIIKFINSEEFNK